MKITNEFIASLRPCEDRHDNYLKHYSKTSFTLNQFFNLSEITANDKIWVFARLNNLEKQQQQFSLTCADRAVVKANVPELNGFFTLVCHIVVNDLWELKDTDEYRAASKAANAAYVAESAAYKAADETAHWAADAAESAAYYAAADAAYWAAADAAYWAAADAAYWAAYYAADSAAYGAADSAAEREVQLDIIKSLI